MADDASAGCSLPVSQIEVDAGDLDDSVTVAGALPARMLGGDGADRLLGGGAGDFADGGEGDDSIEMRDGISDSVWCSGGRDSVRGRPSMPSTWAARAWTTGQGTLGLELKW